MDIKNYLGAATNNICLATKSLFKTTFSIILVLIALILWMNAYEIMDSKATESLGLFMFGCSIFVYLGYRYLTINDNPNIIGLIKFILLSSFAFIICAVVNHVISNNLFNNVYPAEADSISIPILSTVISFVAVAPFALLISFVSLSKYDESNQGSKFWFLIKAVSYLGSYLILTLVALFGIIYWGKPHHYLISYSYTSLMALIQAIFIFDLYRVYVGYKRNKL